MEVKSIAWDGRLSPESPDFSEAAATSPVKSIVARGSEIEIWQP
jgi:hypothetical protein